ncbi:MAG: hypothetical protein GC200_12285 [Tepidisphaera sp.]|nr:hypothetical protein [Tepidisphaera sp.]
MDTQVPATTERRFPCKQCGAKLEFAPGTSALKCPFCGCENQIAPEGEAQELDFKATLAKQKEAAPTDFVAQVTCQACAAIVSPPANVTSFSCPFCGTNIVVQPGGENRIRPNAVLPFKITKDQAAASFKKWIKSLWFAPSKLRSQSMLDSGITGVYMPAWTYDAHTDTRYTGQRGDAYYETEWVTVNGRRESRQVRRIRWTSVSGRVENDFDDVVVLAGGSLPTDKARKLEPWDTHDAVPYADDYLAGFTAECYRIDLADGFVIAQGLMEPEIDSTICGDIGGDEQRISSKDTAYSDITFKHLLLPVWISAYRFQGKVFHFLVNARTGEVQGERPWSAIKIALAVTFGVIVLLIAIYLTARN